MVEMAGTYQHIQTTNPEIILKTFKQDISEKYVEALRSRNAKLTIQVNGDEYIISSAVGDWWKRETTFTLGQPFYENLEDRDKITTTVYKRGDELIFKSSAAEQKIDKVYAFTNDGVTMIFRDGNALAKRVYKRV